MQSGGFEKASDFSKMHSLLSTHNLIKIADHFKIDSTFPLMLEKMC